MTSLIEFVNTYSLADLKKESDKWNQIAADRKQAITKATEEYNQAYATARLVDSAIRMREAQESQNGHKSTNSSGYLIIPAAGSSASPSPEMPDEELDKTATALETLRQAHGLRPGELYQALLKEGMTIRRPYVSTILMRLKQRGQVYVESGKYFAKA